MKTQVHIESDKIMNADLLKSLTTEPEIDVKNKSVFCYGKPFVWNEKEAKNYKKKSLKDGGSK